jgi:hypothetical protein
MPLAHDEKIRSKTREDKKPVKEDEGPVIPSEVLSTFLEEKLTPEESAKVNRVAKGHLWSKGEVERYRINLWAKDSSADSFCDSHYILKSFFVCYDREFSVLSDKTL